jgi:FlaA1/EpsC-like NDP-sugar epimerase
MLNALVSLYSSLLQSPPELKNHSRKSGWRSFHFEPARIRRLLVIIALYSGIASVSFYVAYEVRFDFIVPAAHQDERLRLLAFVIGIKLLSLIAVRQFGSVLTYFSIPDLLRVVCGMVIASALIMLPRWIGFTYFSPPRGVLLTDFLVCLSGICAVRLGTRMFRERVTSNKNGVLVASERIAIVGAGDAGASLASDFINSPRRGFKPIAFFDDDISKHGKRIHGVPVVGAPETISDLDEGISKVVIAMPSGSSKRIREVVLLMTQLGFKVETLPSLAELASGVVKASRVRPVEVQDLLGREAVNLDSAAIQNLVEDRIVMVTGAGGSIGGELCRQIARLNPKRLLMVEQAEGSLFNIEQELNENGLGSIALPLVADILDPDRMDYIFSRHRPEIVFHAAAHKHVFMMERQPAEAVSNNVLGTRQMALLAHAYQTKAFVFISTDKAINPTSVMGATKRLAEIQLMAIASREDNKTKFIAVRFGNVLGSSGSVIPIFKRQIANGGPVTVTHPDVTRYFMTIPEAVGLVLQSSVLGQGGEIFVLDMGQPVKIVDLARQMIQLSGFKPDEDIEVKFTGLKPGEKLFEELQHKTELHASTPHPRIMRFTPQAMFSESGVQELEEFMYRMEPNELKQLLKRLVPEYEPYLD